MIGGRDLDVIGVGDAAVDIYLEVDRIPGTDQKVMARSVERRPGGMVANFVVACRRLGLRSGFNGVVGDDELGRQTLDDLALNGVDLEAAIVRPDGTTYFCVILLDSSGEKALVVVPTDCLSPQPDDVSESAVRRARHLHTTNGNVATAIRAAGLAKRHGLSVSLDVEAAAEIEELRRLLVEVDILFVGPEAARASTDVHDLEEAVDQLIRLGPRIVCLTLGAAGSIVRSRSEHVRASAFPVPVVDSTGAGDCFAATFVHGYLEGWPLGHTARFASAAGALGVTKAGGHAGAPTMDELTSFLAER